MPDPEVVQRRPLPARPDPAAQLIEAIQHRDGTGLRRLVGAWVHRRGLASLHDFWATGLPNRLEVEDLDWVQGQGVVPWSTGADGFSPRGVLDQALSAYAEAIGDPEPPPAFPPAAIPTVAIPTPFLSWEEASVPASLEAWAPLEAADPPPAAGADAPAAADAAALPPPPEPLLRSAPARARRLVSRTRVLLRDCLEEVWVGLAGSSSDERLEAAQTRAAAEARESFERQESSEGLDAAEIPEAGAFPQMGPAGEQLATAPPLLTEVPLPSEPLPPTPLPLPSHALVSPRSATVVPPLPAFPLSPPAVAPQRRQPRPLLTVPSLPRATRPAPAPADLADLRMWLPDPNEDLRRAS